MIKQKIKSITNNDINVSSIVRTPNGEYGIVTEIAKNAWTYYCKVLQFNETNCYYLHDLSPVRFNPMEVRNSLCEVL